LPKIFNWQLCSVNYTSISLLTWFKRMMLLYYEPAVVLWCLKGTLFDSTSRIIISIVIVLLEMLQLVKTFSTITLYQLLVKTNKPTLWRSYLCSHPLHRVIAAFVILLGGTKYRASSPWASWSAEAKIGGGLRLDKQEEICRNANHTCLVVNFHLPEYVVQTIADK